MKSPDGATRRTRRAHLTGLSARSVSLKYHILTNILYEGDKHFHFANGLEMGSKSLWDEGQRAGLSVEERVAQLERIPDDHWGEIYIIAQMPKQDAIDLGLDVVKPIAGLFKVLLPVYEAAVR